MKGNISNFLTPANLKFGEGAIREIPVVLSEQGHKKILVVTDKNLLATGIPEKILTLVQEKGIQTILFSEVRENPTEKNVEQGRDIILENHCDAVLAVGGGSSMDAAKAMSMLSAQGRNTAIADYEYGLQAITKRGPAIYLVPTTSGTGSEATFWSVITNEKTHRKFDVGSPYMAASVSFVDPELTYTLPPAITAATGMDALCHGFESLVTQNSWNPTKALALEAISLVSANLFTAFSEAENKAARRSVMLGSMIAGMSFPNAGLGAVHGLTAPLGGHFGVPHGVANAIVLPVVMDYNLQQVQEDYAEAATVMNCSDKTGAGAISFISELNRKMNIPNLSSFGVQEKDLEMLAEDALGRNSNCNSNPVKVSKSDAVELLRKCL